MEHIFKKLKEDPEKQTFVIEWKVVIEKWRIEKCYETERGDR